MRHLAVLFAAAALLCATQAAAADDGAPAATPVCGHLQMQPDGTLTAPSGIDPAAIDSARDAVLLFPIDALFDKMSAELKDKISRDRNDATDETVRVTLTQLENDLPAILAVLRQDLVDTIATGIACHQTKSDLDVLAAFLRTPAGQKFAEAGINHTHPTLSAEERAQARDFSSTEAARHVNGEFKDGSQTDVWMKAEFPYLSGEIVTWLKAKYHLSDLGDPV